MEEYYHTHTTPHKLTKKETDKLVKIAFEKESIESHKQITITGFNSLIFNMACRFTTDTIIFDIERYKNQKFNNIRSEEEIHVQINDINFLAYIDRIDTSQNTTNIIDYKTTTSKTKTEVNIIDLITSPESAYHELFQILLYCYIYKLHFGATPTMPTLYKMYSIKSQNGKLSTITLHIPNQLLSTPLPPFDIDLNEINTKDSTTIQITDYQQISTPFEWLVHKLLHDIYDPNKPFTTNIHDTKLKACSYCYYSTICHIKNTK
jgi:hypothetical protein